MTVGMLWLERDGEDSAAARLREGLEETRAARKFELPAGLRGFLLTTNAVGNLISPVRGVARNVSCWRSGDMIAGWTALGVSHAEQLFHRSRGCRYLPLLARAVRHETLKIDQAEEAAP